MLKKTSWRAIGHSPLCETLAVLFTQFPVSVEVNDAFANARWELFICSVKPYARLPWPWPLGGSEGTCSLHPCKRFDQTRWQRAHGHSILSSSLPHAQLTLHQLARPWSLRERCWGCWERTRDRVTARAQRQRHSRSQGERNEGGEPKQNKNPPVTAA